jgi:hypothetical protein
VYAEENRTEATAEGFSLLDCERVIEDVVTVGHTRVLECGCGTEGVVLTGMASKEVDRWTAG